MKSLQVAGAVLAVMALMAGPLMAVEQATAKTTSSTPTSAANPDAAAGSEVSPSPNVVVFSGKAIAAGLGMGLTIIGAGIGFGRIGAAAMEGMARQPEIAARIQTGMLIIAAMLEGATLASVILSYLVSGKAPW